MQKFKTDGKKSLEAKKSFLIQDSNLDLTTMFIWICLDHVIIRSSHIENLNARRGKTTLAFTN
jgi:hypothetical protein